MTEHQSVNYFLDQPFYEWYVEDVDYSILQNIPKGQRRGRDKISLPDCFMMLDTETSKSRPDVWSLDKWGKRKYEENPNYITAWSFAVNVFGWNICVVWGNRPEQIPVFLEKVGEALPGNQYIVYVHNLAYDWVFLRKFLFEGISYPEKQLNTKPHYPILIQFNNGLQLRDSYILSQRSIKKWAEDYNVDHQKAVGSWDYDRLRNQGEDLTGEERHYIFNDVLAGVECLAATRRVLRCQYAGMPYTATGIPRKEAKKRGERWHAHERAKACYTSLSEYLMLEKVFHGGYTHASRHACGWIRNDVTAYDFSSSYPFCMLARKFPVEKFTPWPADLQEILRTSDNNAYVFTFSAINIRLRDPGWPFPALQMSKAEICIDGVFDNGRILEAKYIEIPLTETDLITIYNQYAWDKCEISDCYQAAKNYLPKWLRDYVYEVYQEKTMLKGGDPVLYAITKAKLNSLYGMCVQKLLKDEIEEDPETGEYKTVQKINEEEFSKAIKRRSTFLFYAWGVWVTAYAQQNIFDLLKCVPDPEENALYIDTDSLYAERWDMDKLAAYNQRCRDQLATSGYGPVEHNGREYLPGIAEKDGCYSEFTALHAKSYACRDAETGKLKITVAGVPKKTGAGCLRDDIRNFKAGFVFSGEETGKLTHFYQYVPEIFRDERGNLIADSINLVPCDYLLSWSIEKQMEEFEQEEVIEQIYE